MLTTSTRLRLQNICSRLAQGQFVSLQERVYLQKFAERDRSVSTWVNKAQRFQREGVQQGLDGLMADLDLGRRHPDDGCWRPTALNSAACLFCDRVWAALARQWVPSSNVTVDHRSTQNNS